jgi:hypothetical protein
MGPEGVFIPAPPGSVLGIIIPAPIGTAPAVVTSAPPVVSVGMRVTTINNTTINNTTINNTTINNTTINNVSIVAPASATATHQAVNVSVPAQAHLAAALTPVVRAMAPAPASTKPIAPYVPGHAVALPAPQTVHAVVPAELAHPRPAAAGVEKPGAPAARTPEAKEVPANQAMRAAPKPEPNPAMTMKKEAEPAHQPPHPANNLKEEQDAAAKKRAADAAEANKTKAEAAAEADKKKAEAAEEANKKKAEAAADANKKKAEVAEANKQKADSAADANKKKADAAAEAKKQAAEKAAAEKAAAEKRKENPPQ